MDARGNLVEAHVHVVLYAVERESNKGRLRSRALELPGEVVPGKCRRRGTCDAGVQPVYSGARPYVPHAAVFDIALGAEDELVSAIGLIYIKLQGLTELRGGQVEIHVIPEVRGVVICAKLFPPESIGIGSGTADAEHRGTTVKGRRTLVLRHGKGRGRPVPAGSSADRAVFPPGQIFNLREGRCIRRYGVGHRTYGHIHRLLVNDSGRIPGLHHEPVGASGGRADRSIQTIGIDGEDADIIQVNTHSYDGIGRDGRSYYLHGRTYGGPIGGSIDGNAGWRRSHGN